MKVALSSSGKDLDSQIEPRFGRCPYFLIAETEDMSFQVYENESMSLGGGAGIQSAQFVASMGAEVVITGNCGPNAVQTLSAAGIELFTGQSGTIREAIEQYKTGKLRPSTKANVPDHYGMDRGMGRGMSMGRGMGGMSGQEDLNLKGSGQLTREQELRTLKNQATDLKKQMEVIEARIKKLEKSD